MSAPPSDSPPQAGGRTEARPAPAPLTGGPSAFRQGTAERAYEKWVARGRTGGTPLQDWLEAEAESRQATDPAAQRAAGATPLAGRGRADEEWEQFFTLSPDM